MTLTEQQQAAFEAFKKGAMLAGNDKWAAAHPHFLEAFKNDQAQIRYALYLGGSMWEMGQKEEAVEFWSIAADYNPSIRTLQLDESADGMTRQVSRVADSQIRVTLSGIQDEVLKSAAKPGRMATAFWPQTHRAPTRYIEDGPRPYMFFAPDMPATPIFNRQDAAWTQELEAKTSDIRAEFLALAQSKTDAAPYVHASSQPSAEWDKLRGQDLWTSFHLFKDGVRTDVAQSCPATCAAISKLPLVTLNGEPMEVFFSVLKAGAHIPPHYGLANSRVTVHLPLIIPEDCAIRVGDETHSWIEGETFIFDDSYDHEAWNKSTQTRVVLIFEAWRPDMDEGEIKAVEACYAARQAWLSARRIPQ